MDSARTIMMLAAMALIAVAVVAAPAVAAPAEVRNPSAFESSVSLSRGGPSSPPPTVSVGNSSDFEWGDAAIGAGAAFGAVLLAAAAIAGTRMARAHGGGGHGGSLPSS